MKEIYPNTINVPCFSKHLSIHRQGLSFFFQNKTFFVVFLSLKRSHLSSLDSKKTANSSQRAIFFDLLKYNSNRIEGVITDPCVKRRDKFFSKTR